MRFFSGASDKLVYQPLQNNSGPNIDHLKERVHRLRTTYEIKLIGTKDPFVLSVLRKQISVLNLCYEALKGQDHLATLKEELANHNKKVDGIQYQHTLRESLLSGLHYPKVVEMLVTVIHVLDKPNIKQNVLVGPIT